MLVFPNRGYRSRPSYRDWPHSTSGSEMGGRCVLWGPEEYTDHGDIHLLLFKLQCLRLKSQAPSSKDIEVGNQVKEIHFK